VVFAIMVAVASLNACDNSDAEMREVSTRVSGALDEAEQQLIQEEAEAAESEPRVAAEGTSVSAPELAPRDVHFDAIVLDTHVDTPQGMTDSGFDLSQRHERGHLDLPRMHEGGLDGAFFSIWVNPRRYRGDEAFDRALALFNAVHNAAWRSSTAEVADSVGDVLRVVSRGGIALLFGVEGGHALGSSDEVTVMSRLHSFRALGARYMTVTWSTDNPLGHSSTDDHPERGLTALGASVIREMERIGIIVDVSHVSDQTFWDIMEIATKPVIASHSSVRALADHPRNMTDDMIRRVAEGGGAVCINYFPYYLDTRYASERSRIHDENPEAYAEVENADLGYTERGPVFRAIALGIEPDLDVPDVGTIADHIMHIVDLVGAQAVCLGSDFDGVPAMPLGLSDVSVLPALSEELSARGVGADDLRLILGGNVMRILGTN